MTRPTVLAYYFPSWHRDPRNAEWFGAGWTEWELVKGATTRFPGHRQPRVPALGCRKSVAASVADRPTHRPCERGCAIATPAK